MWVGGYATPRRLDPRENNVVLIVHEDGLEPEHVRMGAEYPPQSEFDPWTAQPVVCRYTDHAITRLIKVTHQRIGRLIFACVFIHLQ
jgi:hypothetical protein